jgi:hypothetical protein
MKKFKTILASVLFMFGIVAAPLAVGSVSYAAPKDQVCNGIGSIGGGNACTNDNAKNGLSNFLRQIINILLFIIGAIAVVMIIIGGLRYVLSGGDQSQITGAKNTILYAVVGLVVAIMAYAIVNFVVGAL